LQTSETKLHISFYTTWLVESKQAEYSFSFFSSVSKQAIVMKIH